MSGSGSLLWAVAGLVGLASLTPALDKASPAPQTSSVSATGYTILRAPDGQFYADVSVGSDHVRMLVDPGASTVLLTPADAARLGIASGEGFSRTSLPTLALGPIGAAGVEAVVAPDLPVSLLGRSFLDQVAVSVEHDRMVLR